ncbi:MAG: phytoene/squalene synthase family protein [Patescibacteria group bacterium]|nr:phytoene/squalene synthase family protein [Patescibacteria group bacterium]
MNLQQKIFKNGSITYYYSSLFFPKEVKKEVFTLYAYVRTADNFVDVIPQKKEDFYNFKKLTKQAFREKTHTGNIIIDDCAALFNKRKIPQELIFSFLSAMEKDLTKKDYEDFSELDQYMYGSANVIGIMMAYILDLPKKSFPYAELLGKAMQYANFIRDINEDISLGRIYIPKSELIKHNLTNKDYLEHQNAEKMSALIRSQIKIYYKIQNEAENGFRYIPKKYRIPIQTASNLYKWTINKIYKNPMIVFEKKVKPSPYRVIKEALSVWISLL